MATTTPLERLRHWATQRVTDLAAHAIGLTIATTTHLPHRNRILNNHYATLIEDLAQEINGWENLYQTTRQQLALQIEANERLLTLLDFTTQETHEP